MTEETTPDTPRQNNVCADCGNSPTRYEASIKPRPHGDDTTVPNIIDNDDKWLCNDCWTRRLPDGGIQKVTFGDEYLSEYPVGETCVTPVAVYLDHDADGGEPTAADWFVNVACFESAHPVQCHLHDQETAVVVLPYVWYQYLDLRSEFPNGYFPETVEGLEWDYTNGQTATTAERWTHTDYPIRVGIVRSKSIRGQTSYTATASYVDEDDEVHTAEAEFGGGDDGYLKAYWKMWEYRERATDMFNVEIGN